MGTAPAGGIRKTGPRRSQEPVAAQIDVGRVRTKEGLIEALSSGLGLQGMRSNNWDAFEECLGYHEAPPPRVVLNRSSSLPGSMVDDLNTLREILESKHPPIDLVLH